MTDISDRSARWLLCAIILVAALLRLATVQFGLPSLNDSDELVFQLGAVKMLRGPTLNPGWFGHPATTTFYLTAILDAVVFAVGWLFGWFSSPKAFADAIYLDPSWVMLPSRIMIVAFGLLVILLTARLGKELFGRPVGLVAAGLLALSPVHVTWSQVLRADMMGCAFMLLGLLAAVRVARQGTTADTAKAAIWIGLAVASKWPFAITALAMLGVLYLRVQGQPQQRGKEFRRFAGFAIGAGVALLAISPYLLLDYKTAIHDISGEAQPHHLGATGGSLVWNAGWYIANPLLTAFGPVGLALCVLGLILAAPHREARYILGPVGIGLFVLLAAQHLVWERWALPLLPLLAIVAGVAIVWLARQLDARMTRPVRHAALAALALAICGPLLATNIAEGRERLNDTRQQATRWLIANARPGSTVIIEGFAFDLVGKPYSLLFPVGEAGCLDVMKGLRGQVSLSKVKILREGQANVDFGTVAPSMLATCRADYAVISQYDRYAAERDQFPVEYAQYRRLIAQGHQVAIFYPPSGSVRGLIVRVIKFDRYRGVSGRRSASPTLSFAADAPPHLFP